ncbi:hypothetical protein G9A89_008626 [Geosiphon pyriformis]|nr:hypothetical protein G9A89_008626 [Geosiphon pyriformis]
MLTTDGANPFGQGIPFHRGKPIKFLHFEDGRIKLNPDAIDILMSIEGNIGVVSVVGKKHTGKSHFANILHGRHDGFEMGSKLKGTTEGVFMWDTPFQHEEGLKVLVLDFEGFDEDSLSETTEWHKKLFILALSISTNIVYTVDKFPTSHTIDQLLAANNLMEMISKENDDNYNVDIGKSLIFLLKDCIFETNEMNEYFQEKLDKKLAADSYNSFADTFSEVEVFGIPPPGLGLADLRKMNKVMTNRFDKDYIVALTKAVNGVLSNIGQKNNPAEGTSAKKFLARMDLTLNYLNNQLQQKISPIIPIIDYEFTKDVEAIWNQLIEPGLQEGTPFENEFILKNKLFEFYAELTQLDHEDIFVVDKLFAKKEKLAIQRWKSFLPKNLTWIVDFKVNSSDFRGLPWPAPGWKWDKTDLNQDHGGKFIHIGYKLANADDDEYISKKTTGFSWNPKGKFWTHSDCVTALSYLAYDEPLTTKPSGWDFWSPQDLSEGTGGKYIYLVWNVCGDKPPVLEIYFEFSDESKPPVKEGWIAADQDLCAGSGGTFLWGYYRTLA